MGPREAPCCRISACVTPPHPSRANTKFGLGGDFVLPHRVFHTLLGHLHVTKLVLYVELIPQITSDPRLSEQSSRYIPKCVFEG